MSALAIPPNSEIQHSSKIAPVPLVKRFIVMLDLLEKFVVAAPTARRQFK
jgi:hypothetical protein